MLLPVVTAIIPCHNHQDWVGDAIKSIAAQDYPLDRRRLIVVDDGSTDTSPSQVFGLMQVKERVLHPEGLTQWIGTVHGMQTMLATLPKATGPSGARNMGIKIGWEGTDYFAFLDSDDIYHKQKISKSVEVFLTAPDHIAAVYSDFSTWNPTTGLSIRQYKEPFSRERLTRECIVNCDSLISKLAIQTCGSFDEDLRVCEDYDLWLRLSERFVIHHLAEDLVTIRVGEHSSTSTVMEERWNRDYRRVFEKARERNA